MKTGKGLPANPAIHTENIRFFEKGTHYKRKNDYLCTALV